MTAVPYLLALLMAKAEGDDDTAAELADVLGDEEHAGALLEMAEGGDGERKAFRKAAAHAPAGGVTVGGVHYTGGQFIPGDVMENATPEERAAAERAAGAKQRAGSGGGSKTVVGRGNTGDVTRDGKEVVKNTVRPDGTKTREGQFYKDLSGVVGIAPGRQDGDKVRLPHYQEVLSIDTVKDEATRKRMGSVVGENKSRILNAVNALSESGIDYNDPLQFGYDDDFNAHLIDLSNAGNVDQKTALRANIDRAARYLDDFGAEKAARDVRRAFSAYSTAQMFAGQSADAIQKRVDNLVARGNAKAVEHIQSIGPEKLAGYDVKHVYYSNNPRPVERGGILQSEPDGDGLKVILSDKPLDADTIRQYGLTPVVHPAERQAKKPGSKG